MRKLLFSLTALSFLSVGAQTVTTEAGINGNTGYQPSTGNVTTVPFNEPFGIVVDTSDRVYVSDAQNHRVSLVLIGNQVIAKTGYTLDPTVGGASYINATGTNSKYNSPRGMCLGPDGYLYVADYNNHAIRKMNGVVFINDQQSVTTFAGEAPGGSLTGDLVDANGTSARFDSPIDICLGGDGNFYVADNWNECIRKITPTGDVTTLAGSKGMTGDVDGTGSAARFDNILAVVKLDATHILVADAYNNKIRKINTTTGEVTTFAGTGATGHKDGDVSVAEFNAPSGLAVDALGNVYVAEGGGSQSNVIRKISSTGEVTTICGEYQSGTTYQDGQGTDARFLKPMHMAFNKAGNVLYVCDSYNNVVRAIDIRPKARFVADQVVINVGAEVQFTSQSLNSPTGYQWTLNPATGFTLQGGTSLTSENPLIKFNTAGSYTVKLSVTNAFGSGDTTRNNYINVSNINTNDPPVADFVASDSFPMVTETVTFTDMSSNQPSSWEWTIAPTTYTFVGSSTAQSQNPQVQFTAVGKYSVFLKATNVNGSNTKSKLNYIDVSPLGVNETSLQSMIQVFPNPSDGNFTLLPEPALEGVALEVIVYDVNGKRVREQSVKGEKLTFEGLDSGIYLIVVSDGQQQFREKVIVR